MSVKSMQDLLLDVLKDTYDAEKRITKALPKMMRAASSEELISAFERHLGETEEQIERLDRIFEELQESPGRKVCDAMVGLIREGEKAIEETEEGPVRDAALIAAAQKVEHYEIAAYGCLRDWSQKLGHDSIIGLVQQTLDEEGETDKLLTEIAQSLNLEAIEEGESEMSGSMRSGGNSRRSSSSGSRGGTKKSHGGGSRSRGNGGRSRR